MNRWEGRVALVTGATAGIGRAVAVALHAAGLRVVACGRRQAQLDALASELGTERLFAVQCDLRNEADILAMFAAVAERWQGVDVCINNAGLGVHASLMDGATDGWRQMLDVNVLALAICTRESLAQMKKNGVNDGVIVNISSMSGHRVVAPLTMYSATKHAVKAMTEGLRQELRAAGSGNRVTAISPGYVETEFAFVLNKDDPSAAEKVYASMKCLTDQDIVDAVVYALSVPPHCEIHDILMRPTAQRT